MRTRNWGEQGAASLGILEREAARVIAETGKRPGCGRRDSPAERGRAREERLEAERSEGGCLLTELCVNSLRMVFSEEGWGVLVPKVLNRDPSRTAKAKRQRLCIVTRSWHSLGCSCPGTCVPVPGARWQLSQEKPTFHSFTKSSVSPVLFKTLPHLLASLGRGLSCLHHA